MTDQLRPLPAKLEPDNDEVVYIYSLTREQPVVHFFKSAAEGTYLMTMCNEQVKFSMGGANILWQHAKRLTNGRICARCVSSVKIWEERYQLRAKI